MQKVEEKQLDDLKDIRRVRKRRQREDRMKRIEEILWYDLEIWERKVKGKMEQKNMEKLIAI